MNVILQPMGGKTGIKNYDNTIKSPVILDETESFTEDERKQLLEIYPDGIVPTWGVTPAKNGSNISKWQRVQRGDTILFCGDKSVQASAIVTLKTHNKALALELWGEREPGMTWEYVYFLDEIQKQEIDQVKINRLIDYPDHKAIQGFTVLNPEKSEAILSNYDFSSEVYFPEVDEDDFKSAAEVNFNEKNLDKKTQGYYRVEQGYLRQHLFGKRHFGTCRICNERYPVGLLVAAHIKKRSKCSVDERLDYKNIVMPMCKFGCDDLFERGFISIVDGEVSKNPKKIITDRVERYIETLIGNKCTHWNDQSATYFNWQHLKNT